MKGGNNWKTANNGKQNILLHTDYLFTSRFLIFFFSVERYLKSSSVFWANILRFFYSLHNGDGND